MSPEQQEYLDNKLSIFDLQEENDIFKRLEKNEEKKAQKILDDMVNKYQQDPQKKVSYDYKTFNELCKMNLDQLNQELTKIRAYNKNLEKIIEIRAKQKNESTNDNSNSVNQIKMRVSHGR